MKKTMTITLDEDDELKIENSGFTKVEFIGICEHLKHLCLTKLAEDIELRKLFKNLKDD